MIILLLKWDAKDLAVFRFFSFQAKNFERKNY